MQTPFSTKAQRARSAYLAQYETLLGLEPMRRRRRSVDKSFMRELAAAWQDARHAPSDPVVALHYQRFIEETLTQFTFLEEQGIKFERTSEVSPYATVIDLARDLDLHGRVLVWSGGTLPVDHPLAARGLVPGHGTWRTLDALRGVHEVFGHAVGNSFKTLLGEDLAFQDHVRLYTRSSWAALTSEFRAPLAWLMFGPHLEEGDARPRRWEDLPYPPQKAVALPPRFWATPSGKPR